MSDHLLNEYVDNIKSLLDSEEIYDVKINVGTEPYTKEFHAHSFILYARCPFFKTALSEASKGYSMHYVFEKTNISVLIFETILKFLYTSQTNFDNHTGYHIFELLNAAEDLGLESLFDHTMKYFIENHDGYINQNTVNILQSIYNNKKYDGLKNICLEKICADSRKLFEPNEFELSEENGRIFNSNESKLLEEPILLEILGRDNFYADEIEVWENILKWGLAKHPEIEGGVKDWSSDNFENLRNTLKGLINLIRFRDIFKEDFHNKITPYQKLFPEDLWNKILHYYLIPGDATTLNLLPSRDPKIQPMIFNQKITLLFASWIDKKNPPYHSMNQVKYKFKLLFSRTRDGLVPKTFHHKCDHVTKTLVIAKVQNTDQIVGGFNPVHWRGENEYKNSKCSFIFNITNKNDINTAKLSYANGNGKKAIYCYPDYLPVFGYGYDLKFDTDGGIFSDSSTYDKIDIVNKSKFDELEVFEIIDNDQKIQPMIFNQKITLLFASWIDKKDPPYDAMNQIKYKFKLLFRRSRDGLVEDTFHSKCDHVTRTLVIAKIQNTDQIIGGFNPMHWGGENEYKNSSDSFIFNITVFGYGYDLKFNTDESISSVSRTYDPIDILNKSRFDELEVFEIIDKDEICQNHCNPSGDSLKE